MQDESALTDITHISRERARDQKINRLSARRLPDSFQGTLKFFSITDF